MEAWKPCDLILTSRLKVRDRAQKLLFERHEEYFPKTSVPSSIVRKTQGGRTSRSSSPGPLPNQQKLALNDVVVVPRNMPARSSAACGARTGLLAMPSQSTRAKVSPLQTRKRSGSSMITLSGRILPTWPYQECSISASLRG